MRLNLGKRLLPNRSDYDVISQRPRRIEHEKRKLPVSRDEPEFFSRGHAVDAHSLARSQSSIWRFERLTFCEPKASAIAQTQIVAIPQPRHLRHHIILKDYNPLLEGIISWQSTSQAVLAAQLFF